MRLEDIEEGERLLAEAEEYPKYAEIIALRQWLRRHAPDLIAAAKAAASERARADKAEAELAKALDASGTREWWLRMSKLQAATTHPKEQDHEQ